MRSSIDRSLLLTDEWLPTNGRRALAADCSPPTTRRLVLTAEYSRPTTGRLLLDVCDRPPTSDRLILAACSWPPTRCRFQHFRILRRCRHRPAPGGTGRLRWAAGRLPVAPDVATKSQRLTQGERGSPRRARVWSPPLRSVAGPQRECDFVAVDVGRRRGGV